MSPRVMIIGRTGHARLLWLEWRFFAGNMGVSAVSPTRQSHQRGHLLFFLPIAVSHKSVRSFLAKHNSKMEIAVGHKIPAVMPR